MSKFISADIEASYRAMVKEFRGSVSTIDGGTMWTTASSTAPLTTFKTTTFWTTGTFKPILLDLSPVTTSGTYTVHWEERKPAHLSKAQQAMVQDAIIEQLLHPPLFHPPLSWSASSGTGSVGSISSCAALGEW